MRLVLLRHGRTAANDARLYCGATDVALSEAGRSQLLQRRERVRAAMEEAGESLE